MEKEKNVCPKCKHGKMFLNNDFYDSVYYKCNKCDHIENK